MNFLAHLLLSAHDEALMVGNFMADFVPNRVVATLPEAVQRGIGMHRFIDRYTDNHPLVRQATRRLHARHHKYAPVLVDVYYDFLLAQNWSRFAQMPIEDFASRAYEVLLRHRHLMPPRLQERLDLMVADDWLRRYRTLEGMRHVFERMKRYVSRPEWLEGAVDSLIAQRALLEEEFLIFFSEVQKVLERRFPGGRV